MATYRMDDGTVVKTENATKTWEQDTFWDGSNTCSVATGSQWNNEALHRSRKSRYWIEHTSCVRGVRAHAGWISSRLAAQWLIANGHELPDDLASLEEEVSE
jgi:hypothetical protein